MTPRRQRNLAAYLLVLAALLTSSLSSAEEEPDASVTARAWLAPHTTPKATQVAGGATVGLTRSLAVLALTAVLGGAAMYLRQKKTKPPRKSSAALRVLGSTRVGQRGELVLAEVAGRKILLGVTDSAVRKLGWIDTDDQEQGNAVELARPRLVGQAAAGTRIPSEEPLERTFMPRSFRDVFKDALGGLGRSSDDSAATQLAERTRDTFSRSQPTPAARQAPVMVDIEGQAQGLLARLREPRS
jgi:flagellar biogenesis protein FliO